jgi:hypothetical protein
MDDRSPALRLIARSSILRSELTIHLISFVILFYQLFDIFYYTISENDNGDEHYGRNADLEKPRVIAEAEIKELRRDI